MVLLYILLALLIILNGASTIFSYINLYLLKKMIITLKESSSSELNELKEIKKLEKKGR